MFLCSSLTAAKTTPWKYPIRIQPGSDSGFDTLEVWIQTRYCDASFVSESILFFGFSEQLTEQRMVKVYNRHQNSMKVAVFLTDVNRRVTFRNRVGFTLNRVLTDRRVSGVWYLRPEKPGAVWCEAASPAYEFRDGFWFANRLSRT